MKKPKKTAPPILDCPDVVEDQAILVPEGETRYWLLLDDASVEILASGICPEHVAQRAYSMLDWKREQYRVQALRQADVAPLFKESA